MKNKLIGNFAVLVLGFSSALSVGAFAQTTDPGPGPSDQPNAPMEVGQDQPQEPQAAEPQGPDIQEADAQPTEAAPGGPSGEAPAKTDQGVARVSLIHGDVSTQRGDSGDWSAVTLNQPVMTGDKISTGDNARTELQLDFANTLRLGANSKANVSNLTTRTFRSRWRKESRPTLFRKTARPNLKLILRTSRCILRIMTASSASKCGRAATRS